MQRKRHDQDNVHFQVLCGSQDKKLQTVVNNDSGEIMEMLNSEFNELCPDSSCPDLFPNHLQEEINQLNDYMSDNINTGVYKCGFAQSQVCYALTYISSLLGVTVDMMQQTNPGLGQDPYLPSDTSSPLYPTCQLTEKKLRSS